MNIQIAHCVHCHRITLNPESDTCDCGGEMYPSVKLVPLGKAVGLDELGLSWEVVSRIPCRECGSTVPHACPGRPEDNVDYRLRLTHYGSRKIQVVKVLRDQLGVNLSVAVGWVNNVPINLGPALSKTLAEEVRDALVEAGATVETVPEWVNR